MNSIVAPDARPVNSTFRATSARAAVPEGFRPYLVREFYDGGGVYHLPFAPFAEDLEGADWQYSPGLDISLGQCEPIEPKPVPAEVLEFFEPFTKLGKFRREVDERLGMGPNVFRVRVRGEEPARDRAEHVERLFDAFANGEDVVFVAPAGYVALRFVIDGDEGRLFRTLWDLSTPTRSLPTVYRKGEDSTLVVFCKATTSARVGHVYEAADGSLQVWSTGHMLPIRIRSLSDLQAFDFDEAEFVEALDAGSEDALRLALLTLPSKRFDMIPVAAEAGRIGWESLTVGCAKREWIVPGVYGAGDKVLVATRPSVGKTTHSLEEAACLATGRSVFGSGSFRPVRAAVIESEWSSNLGARRAAAAEGHPDLAPADVLFSVGSVKLDDEAAVSAFLDDFLASVPLGVDLKPLGSLAFGIAADHLAGSEAQLDTWAKAKAGLDRIQSAIAERQGGLRPKVTLYQHPNRSGDSLAGSIGQERFFDTVLRCPSKPKPLKVGAWVEYRLSVDKAREGFGSDRPAFWMGLAEVEGELAPVARLVEPVEASAPTSTEVEVDAPVAVEDDRHPLVRLFDEVEAEGYARLDDLRGLYLEAAEECSTGGGRGACSGSTIRCSKHKNEFYRLKHSAIEAGLLVESDDDRGLTRG